MRDLLEVIGAFRQVDDGVSLGQALGDLEAFQPRVAFDAFADYCQKSLEAAADQSEKFEGGGVFVGDVMSARGLSWPLVIVLGLVEKSFPRPVREDPLLADEERARISAELPRKLNGYDEERLLFSLATAAAREKRTAARIARYTRQRDRAYWTEQANRQVWI